MAVDLIPGSDGHRFFTPGADFYPDPKDPKKCIKKKDARALLLEFTDEYRFLASQIRDSPAALQRYVELAREMRKISDFFLSKERTVEVDVPQAATGELFRVGDRKFWPGKHAVPKSVAQVLTHMIDTNRRVASKTGSLATNNGYDIPLPAIGNSAREVGGGEE